MHYFNVQPALAFNYYNLNLLFKYSSTEINIKMLSMYKGKQLHFLSVVLTICSFCLFFQI